jgi:5-methyltetrahydrofolate--homocysteine methyltransferase
MTTASALEALLATKPVLLADGATGTNLFQMGLMSGDSPELWNVEQPEKIRALAQSFVDAGSDIILTNTFGANRRRLMLHNLQDRCRELNMAAVKIAREAAATADRKIIIAGSVGPTGDLFAPLGALTEAEAVEVFVEQMTAMKDAGADVAWIETMSAVEEMRACRSC